MQNKNDPRVIRTRQLIQKTFIELGEEKGFDAITVKAIADRATINRATFYAHYEDKYALLNEMTELAFQKSINEHLTEKDTFSETACCQLIALTHEYIINFYKVCKMDAESIASLVDDKVKDILQQTIEGLLLQSTKVPRNPKLVAAMTGATIYGAALYWVKTNQSGNISELAEVVTPYVITGTERIC